MIVNKISRCQLGNHDVLINLLTNWDEFYWLTGEFPPTFNMILTQIRQSIPRRRGPNNVLDLENQVSFRGNLFSPINLKPKAVTLPYYNIK